MRMLLKNGKIYDGTGSNAFKGDILIEMIRLSKLMSILTPKQTRFMI